MISIKEALNILNDKAEIIGVEKIPLSISINRVLAEDVVAGTNFPPFNKSAVDGYACKKADLDKLLLIKGTIAAGSDAVNNVNEGECFKIMTGAKVPEGADCIVMVEHATVTEDGRLKIDNKNKVDNICFLGEDKKQGELILKKGSVIKNKHIGILASAGMHSLNVYRQPFITVFSTGSELVEPEDIPQPGQIRNANGPQLLSQLYSMGINSLYGGITEDDKVMMEIELSRSIENAHGMILSGGVSMGDYDYVPEILKNIGFEIRFHKLNSKPGKPVLFATKGNKFCFGLPGNPVSSYIQFELLVKPYLWALMGHSFTPENFVFIAGEDFTRKNTSNESFIPVKLNEKCQVVKVPYHGSGHFFALGEAFGLLHFEEGQEIIKEGERTNVRPI